MAVIERFMSYVTHDTRSVERKREEEPLHPSSPGQTALIKVLKKELTEMGVDPTWIVPLDDGSFLVQIPPSLDYEKAPHVALVAHVDTYFGCPGGAKPLIHQYQGGDIPLGAGTVIPANDLTGLEGKRIITADGTTLLGGDDKAGVAALMEFINDLLTGGYNHGPVTVWFCTDEEIGEVGVGFLPSGTADNWDIFLTVDGNELGGVDIGSFYGAIVRVEFTGNDAHPGVAGAKLAPAHYVACKFIIMLGEEYPTPWVTEGEEPFIYVPSLPECTAGKSTLTVYPRSFFQEDFTEMEKKIQGIAEIAAQSHGVTATVHPLEMKYVSTEVAISANQHLLQPVKDALTAIGFEPELIRIRAGTDGSMLNMTHPKIPAPNIGVGARNLHGVREFVVANELELAPKLITSIIQRYAEMER